MFCTLYCRVHSSNTGIYSAYDLDIANKIVLSSTRNIVRRIKLLRGKFFNKNKGHAHMQKSC